MRILFVKLSTGLEINRAKEREDGNAKEAGSNFTGSVVFTGAASGIGQGIAVGFGKAGAKVIAADINKEGGMQTVKTIVYGGCGERGHVSRL